MVGKTQYSRVQNELILVFREENHSSKATENLSGVLHSSPILFSKETKYLDGEGTYWPRCAVRTSRYLTSGFLYTALLVVDQ